RVALVALVVIRAEALRRLLRSAALPEAAYSGIADGNDVVVARSDALDAQATGQHASVSGRDRLQGRDSGMITAVGRTGLLSRIALQRLQTAPGWLVYVGQPVAVLDKAWERPLLLFGLVGVLTVALASGLALLAARPILRPLRQLADYARGVASADGPAGGAGMAVPAGGAGMLVPEGGAGLLLPMGRVREVELLRHGLLAAETSLRRQADAEREAARALAGREAELRALFDASPIGLGRLRGQDEIVEANGVLRAILGIPEEPRRGSLRWTDVMAPESRAATERALTQALGSERGRCTPYEAVFLHADGRRVPALVNFTVLDRDRREAAIFVVDMTQTRRTEHRLRDLLATVDMGAFMMRSLDDMIQYWSSGIERLYGWTAAEAIGQSVHNLLQTVFPIPRAELEAELLRTGRWSGDLKQQARDGRQVIVTVQKLLRRDASGQDVVFELLTDVTAQRQAETALAESEARWRNLAESHPGFVFVTDGDGHNVYTNPQMQQFAGRPAEALLGDGWLGIIHPDDRDRAVATWTEAVRTGNPYEAEYRFRAADGHYAWYLCRGVPQRDAEGRVLRWIGAANEITEIVAARDLAARNAAELERQVEARTKELELTQERLAQAAKMEALGRLAGGVAHDFNNVLQAVQGGVALALNRLHSHPNKVPGYLNIANEAAERGIAVTSRLLTFARRGELSAEPIAAAPLLEDLAQLLRHTLGPSIAVMVEAAADLPALFVDKAQLETVLVNLANNARDAMPSGSGTIRLRAEAPAAAPQLAAGRYVRVAVVDDGAGMPPEVLARVSEPFFTTKPRGAGTGLGLAMARGFAEQSGGTLLIESAPGQGTAVYLWLPAAEAADAAAAQAEAAVPAAKQGRSILVVDDEPIVRTVIATVLADHGHAVTEAPDAAAALSELENGLAVDVLVTDLAMPGALDGLGLIREARRRHPRLPAALLTGHMGDAGAAALEEAAGSGPFAMLHKPVSMEALAARIGVLLDA
ncbi:MAG TPA: PAS domain S-box protein, partial [Rhodopila sp.]|nr:PAS domain S-box protein [Rhodopila sp.]